MQSSLLALALANRFFQDPLVGVPPAISGEPPVDSKTIKVRRIQSKLKKFDPPAPPVLQLIRQAGFGGVIDLPFISLDIGLMTALLERWRPETHSFHLRTGEWTVTLQDVEVLLGLPVNGEPIIGSTNEDWDLLCQRLLGISACLSNLYHYLCHGCKSGNDNVGGAFILLQLWAWERFPFVAPGRLGTRQRPPGSPLGARWDDHFHSPDLATHVLGYYRNYFDIQRADEILVMTQDWDLLYEMALEELPEGGDVSEPTSSANYSFECPMSWQGDGKYFATLSMVHNAASLNKKIKVWERDLGAPHSVSESKSFMGSVLEWMPNGAKIASVCDRMAEKKRPSIVFFKRNGLERSSFSINEAMGSTVEILKWNCHSDLLAAVVRCERYDSLKIWSSSNNHWYLKQEIRCPTQDGVRFMWEPTKPLQLICWTLGGQITIFSFVWLTAVAENSISLVIDCSATQVTPLSMSLIPPPMFLFNLRFPSPVRDIAFWSKGLRNRLAASLSNCYLCVVELPQLDFWEELEGKEFNVEVSYSESSIGSTLHLVWLDSHVLLGASHFGFRHSDCLPETCSGKNGLLPGYYRQEIELVCSEDHVPGVLHGEEAAVILQTSRGNLECIYPRKLVLSSIVNALIQRRFKDALMVRRHRIDFNVIVDHCGWKAFLLLAPEFVRQGNNLSHITEFVCSMKEENIMETLYKNYISLPCLKGANVVEARKFEGSDAINKISAVLMAIRKALEEQVVANPARELCILTTLA
ncbi:hypothetical protein RHMOL_Rhmol03G0147800 [Rhododendron molle]|uniref:Uncharacterized protein n=1 Tax=Rhododendron molle TaxID=49168 RepID=A0ACC0PFH9_RHOML|nr:hypothetical protein RHMOL_Rhmol03G0147800 [Rhododendron molle]